MIWSFGNLTCVDNKILIPNLSFFLFTGHFTYVRHTYAGKMQELQYFHNLSCTSFIRNMLYVDKQDLRNGTNCSGNIEEMKNLYTIYSGTA